MSKEDQASRSDFCEDFSNTSRSEMTEEKMKIKSESYINYKDLPSSSHFNPSFSLDMTLDDVMKICSVILEKIIQFNQKQSALDTNSNDSLSKYSMFESEELPKVLNLSGYIQRISSYLKFDKYILILSMMNLDKFLEKNKDFTLTRLNSYK
jgi:hypothetical protein